MAILKPQIKEGIPEVTVEDVQAVLGQVELIDVRESHEFHGELGHIPGAKCITMGSELTHYLKDGDRNQEIVFICRSGARSGRVTLVSLNMGYKNVSNMTGGMLKWNETYPIKK